MRHEIKKYLADAQANANQQFLGATGERKIGADGFIDRNLYFTNDLNPGGFFPADGQMAAQPSGSPVAAPESQPYILTISNASATQVNNFEIWGADIYSRYTFNSDGSLTINGVTIQLEAGGIPGGYYGALQFSRTGNFTVGKTYLASLSGSTAQVFQPLRVKTYSINGNEAGKLLPSPLAPNQFQPGVFINPMPYRIDGYTTVQINVLASVVFQMWFYPSYDVNLARSLGGNDVGRSYSNPPINIAQPMVLQGQ